MISTDSFDFFVQWHLTERCNLRCRHCYQEGRHPAEMSWPEIRQGVEEIAEMIQSWSEAYEIVFSPSVNVTGGEPFLRPDLFQILELLGHKGFDLYLLSNGILIDRDKARKLSGLGVKGVQVSLEGPEAIHESIRGKGSYSRSLEGIGNLVSEGIQVTLNMTLSELNAGNFNEMVGLSKALGAARLGFSRLVPSGKGIGLGTHLLTREKVKDLYRGIFSHTPDSLEIVSGDPIVQQMNSPENREDTGDIPFGGCAAGLTGLTLLPDGTVYPCRRLPIPIGNIRKDSLRELWITSPVLERLRDKSCYQGKCGRCNRWAACRGCRAIAYAYSKSAGKADYLAEDPQCFI